MTVTSSDSRYSESVVWSPRGSGLFGGSAIAASGMAGCWVAISSIWSAFRFDLFHSFESGAGRALLRFLFGAAFRGGHALAVGPHFNSKRLLVVWTTFSGEPVLRGRAPTALQELLQGGFLVAISNTVAAFYHRCFEKRCAQHFARRCQPGIQENCGDYRFKCVCQQGRLLAPCGFLFTATQPQMFTKVQTSGGTFQRLCIHYASTTLGQLALGPLREGCEEVFACKQIKDRITQKFQSFIVLRRLVASVLALSQAKLRNCGAVRQSALEQRRVPELITQALLQLLVTVGHFEDATRYGQKRGDCSIRSAQLRRTLLLHFFGAALARGLQGALHGRAFRKGRRRCVVVRGLFIRHAEQIIVHRIGVGMRVSAYRLLQVRNGFGTPAAADVNETQAAVRHR